MDARAAAEVAAQSAAPPPFHEELPNMPMKSMHHVAGHGVSAQTSAHQLDLAEVHQLAAVLRAVMLECFNRREIKIPSKPSEAVLAAARCALEQTQSQHSEDLLLLPTLLAAADGGAGTFVELGALDGVRYSNTIVLERCFAWRGLLIEGNPGNFAKLLRSPRTASKVHSAVCEGVGTLNFTTGGDQEAGDTSVLPERARKSRAFRNGNATVSVGCRSLSSMMDDAGFGDTVTFLSLDVQGAEYKVIKASRPERFSFIMSETYGLGSDPLTAQLVDTRVKSAGLRRVTTNESLYVFGSALYARPGVIADPVWPESRKTLRDSIPHFAICKRRLVRHDASSFSGDPFKRLWSPTGEALPCPYKDSIGRGPPRCT